jgi:hypothetical protein
VAGDEVNGADLALRSMLFLCAALVSRRRALSRDQPVTDTTSSRIRPFVRLSAALNARAYLVVISARDVIENPLLMPNHARRYAGIPT